MEPPMTSEREFEVLVDYHEQPRQIFDGVYTGREGVPLPDSRILPPGLEMHPELIEARQWRHYYTDEELNALRRLIALDFRFNLHREWSINSVLRKDIYVQPSARDGDEYSVCYCFDEVSPMRFVFWLVAVLRRSGFSEADYARRIEYINRYRRA